MLHNNTKMYRIVDDKKKGLQDNQYKSMYTVYVMDLFSFSDEKLLDIF